MLRIISEFPLRLGTWQHHDVQKIMDLTPMTMGYWHHDDLKATDSKLEQLKLDSEALSIWTGERLALLEEIKKVLPHSPIVPSFTNISCAVGPGLHCMEVR